MFKGSWDGKYAPSLIILIGIAIFAAMASSAFYLKGGHRADERHYAEYKAREATRDSYRECRRMPTIQEALECQDRASNTSREKQIAEHDLDAQWEMAEWAEYIFFATIFIGSGTLIATALGVYWVKRTLTATADAVNAANETNRIMREEQRPWLDIIKCDVHFSENQVSVFVKVKNKGKTPVGMVSGIKKLYIKNSGPPFEAFENLPIISGRDPALASILPDRKKDFWQHHSFPVVSPNSWVLSGEIQYSETSLRDQKRITRFVVQSASVFDKKGRLMEVIHT